MKFKKCYLILLSFVFFSQLAALDWFAYATDKSDFQIVPLDVMTETAGTPISAARAQALAITPDATTLYVINQNVLNTISVIDLATQTVVNTIPLNNGGINQQPFSIAITPDGLSAYITSVDDLNVHNILHLDLLTGTYTIIPISTDIQADAIAITPDGSMLYITQTSTILGMTIPGNVFGVPIPVPGRTSRLVIAPNGQFAYVSDMINSNVYEINLALDVVSQVIPLTANSQPTNISISPDGKWVFTANENANFATSIEIANAYATTDILLGILPVNYSQQGVAISPDSKKAVFANGNSSQFSTLLIGTTTVTNTSVVGFPAFTAITPDQAPTASFTSALSVPFSPSTFTSTSTSPVGTIGSYRWDFGDGTIVTTTSNMIQHTYLSGGLYNVILTVTNSGGTSTSQIFTGQTMSNNGGPTATITQEILVPNSPISPAPLPPTDFVGTIEKNKFLTVTEYIINATWNASASTDVVFYRIYRNGKIVEQISAGSPHVFSTYLNSKRSANSYQIVAVNGQNIESVPVSITIE